MMKILIGLLLFLSACSVQGELQNDCSNPPVVKHATSVIEPSEEDVRVLYTCDVGFALEGDDEIFCDLDTNEWSADAPSCVREDEFGNEYDEAEANQVPKNVNPTETLREDLAASLDMSCADAPPLPNGYVVKYEKRGSDDGEYYVAIYACNKPYQLEDEEVNILHCSQHTWQGNQPACINLAEEEDYEYDDDYSGKEDVDDDVQYNAPTDVPVESVTPTADPYEPRYMGPCGPDQHNCSQNCELLLFAGENEPRQRCSCVEGYGLDPNDFTSCQDIDECQVKNGGCDQICNNTEGSYYCSCEAGLQIDNKDSQKCVDIDECENPEIAAQCVAGCENTWGSYKCLAETQRTCENGYRLNEETNTCEDVDECAAAENGCDYCRNTEGSYECYCPSGWQLDVDGVHCLDVDECQSAPCDHECRNTDGSYKCLCPENQHLATDGHSCAPDLCEDLLNNEEKQLCQYDCENLPDNSGYICKCPEYYELSSDSRTCVAVTPVVEDRKEQLDACQANDGHELCNPGKCLLSDSNIHGYICDCPIGYEVNPESTGCIDIDECAQSSHQCSQLCYNTIGSYECACQEGHQFVAGSTEQCEPLPSVQCAPGFQLSSDNTTCLDIDECLENNGNCHQLCENSPGSYVCTCMTGYELSDNQPNTCVDIDECASGRHQCTHYCENTLGDYSCSCPGGYVLDAVDGRSCVDVNECETDMHGCSAACQNTVGSYECVCPEGLVLDADKRSCIVPEVARLCDHDNGGCSHGCDDELGCTCPPGYELDPQNSLTCVDVDECAMNNGLCSHICVNRMDGYDCLCPSGYELSSTEPGLCMDVNECLNDKICEYNCENTNGSYVCTCPSGYRLVDNRNCLDVNECLENNGGCVGGQCVNHNGGHSCMCPPGEVLSSDGRTCQIRPDLRDQCPKFVQPEHGFIKCLKYRHKTTHYYSTKCHVYCDNGYYLQGPAVRFCNQSGQWDAFENQCLPYTCPVLPAVRAGSISPAACSSSASRPGTLCNLKCAVGFLPTGPTTVECLKNGTWSLRGPLECLPNTQHRKVYHTPLFNTNPKFNWITRKHNDSYLQCPPNATVTLPKHRRKALVNLQKPVTNLNPNKIIVSPLWAQTYRANVVVGTHEIKYSIFAPNLGKYLSCSSWLTVRHRRPPKIVYCPKSITTHLSANQKKRSIYWTPASFVSDLGLHVESNRLPGELFELGKHLIVYEATNKFGEKAICKFSIVVKDAKVPVASPSSLQLSNHIVSPLLPPVHLSPVSVPVNVPVTVPKVENYYLCGNGSPLDANGKSPCLTTTYRRRLLQRRQFRSSLQQWLPFGNF